MQILERVKGMAFTSNVAPLAYVHVLDIAKDGYIKPHVDAVRVWRILRQSFFCFDQTKDFYVFIYFHKARKFNGLPTVFL